MSGIDAGHEIRKKALLSSVVEEQEANLGNLSGEVLKEIVDRTPMESQATMKLLSKGWRCLISDIQKSKPQPSSSTLLPGIHSDTPHCSSPSSMMERKPLAKPHQQFRGHDVDEVKHIRSVAILEHFLPRKLFNAFLGPNERLNEEDNVCQWCLQKYDHKSRDECPAGDLKCYTTSQSIKHVKPVLPALTIVKIYLPEETEEDDVRKLFEPFGDLRRVKLYKFRYEDVVICYAMVSLVDIDDTEKAVEKLKADGYNIT